MDEERFQKSYSPTAVFTFYCDEESSVVRAGFRSYRPLISLGFPVVARRSTKRRSEVVAKNLDNVTPNVDARYRQQWMCACVCVVFPFSLDVRLVDVPSELLALLFLARRVQPFLSLVDREVELCALTN